MPATRYLFAALSVLALGAYAETLPLSKLPQGWQGGIEVQCREGFCSGEGAVLLQINGRAGSKAPTALGRMTSTCKPKTETC